MRIRANKMSKIKLPPYVVPYEKRKKFHRKVRGTEKEVRLLKSEGKWTEAAEKQYVLRNSWWGYKRYS